MAKQGLSKLQKWILIECYKTLDRAKDWTDGFLYRTEIVYGYFGTINNKAEASTSRAIRNLMKKELIIGHTPRVFCYNNKDLVKIFQDKKPDFSTLLQAQISRETKDMQQRLERYNKIMEKYKEKYKNREKLILPAIYKKETIKLITLTEIGKEAGRCLLLSCEKRSKVNIKDINEKAN